MLIYLYLGDATGSFAVNWITSRGYENYTARAWNDETSEGRFVEGKRFCLFRHTAKRKRFQHFDNS